jgi:hypothetical protein
MQKLIVKIDSFSVDSLSDIIFWLLIKMITKANTIKPVPRNNLADPTAYTALLIWKHLKQQKNTK